MTSNKKSKQLDGKAMKGVKGGALVQPVRLKGVAAGPQFEDPLTARKGFEDPLTALRSPTKP